MRTDPGSPFNLRRGDRCPACGEVDCLIQRFAEHRFDSVCLLCGHRQTWAEQVAAERWRSGRAGPTIEVTGTYSRRVAA